MAFFSGVPIHLRVIFFVLGTVLTFATLESVREYYAREATLDRAGFEIGNRALALRNHTSDSVAVTEVLLSALAERLTSTPTAQGAATLGTALAFAQPDAGLSTGALGIISADGAWISAPLSVQGAETSAAHLALFDYHRTHDDEKIRLGGPVRGSDGEWLLPASRRVTTDDGRFGGVVLHVLEARRLADFFMRFVRAPRDRITLVSASGRILSRAPYDASMVGTAMPIPQMPVPSDAEAGKAHMRYTDPASGERLMIGMDVDHLRGLSLIAASTEDDLLAPWWTEALQRLRSNVLFILLVLILGQRLLHHINKRREGDKVLRQREADFRLLAEHGTDLVERFGGDGRRLYVSPAAARITGYTAEELMGLHALTPLPEDVRTLARAAALRLRDGKTETETITYRLRRKDGVHVWLETSFRAVEGPDGVRSDLVASSRDITARKELELRLETMATLDGLTGLRNRRTFDVQLAHEVERSQRTGRPLSLLIIDADRFKLYNDLYGHVAGDACLRSIAAVVAMAARRPGDLAARYGGEEMVVLLPDADSASAAAIAEDLCRQLQALSIPHSHNKPWQVATASIGVSTLEHHPGDPPRDGQWLVSTADMALYQAKHEGRNRAKIAPLPILALDRAAG